MMSQIDINDLLGDEDDHVDLTPLIDVFMLMLALTLPFMSGVSKRDESPPSVYRVFSASPPESVDEPNSPAEPGPSATLSLSADGQLYWNEAVTSLDALDALVAESQTGDQPLTVFFAGDAESRYGLTIQVRRLLGKHDVTVKELTESEQEN